MEQDLIDFADSIDLIEKIIQDYKDELPEDILKSVLDELDHADGLYEKILSNLETKMNDRFHQRELRMERIKNQIKPNYFI